MDNKLLKSDLQLQIEAYKSYIKVLENTRFNMTTEMDKYNIALSDIKRLEGFIEDAKLVTAIINTRNKLQKLLMDESNAVKYNY